MSVYRLHSWPDLHREADHRIANSLAVISGLVRVRASTTQASDNTTGFLLEVAQRIDTVATLHRIMSRSEADEVGLGNYLKQVCDNLTRALVPTQTLLTFSCSADNFVPFRVALPLGLIIGELVSNSVKYAHPTASPTRITIGCILNGSGIYITYDDDGVGFPKGFDFLRDGNLGLRLIHSLVNQLAGVHGWKSDALGIRFNLRLPSAVLGIGREEVSLPRSPQQATVGTDAGAR
jgi:two-component sensor histidine kinase